MLELTKIKVFSNIGVKKYSKKMNNIIFDYKTNNYPAL